MGLEVPRYDARSAEGVEYPELVPADTPLNLFDRAADLPEQGPLVPDVGDQLAGQIIRILFTGDLEMSSGEYADFLWATTR